MADKEGISVICYKYFIEVNLVLTSTIYGHLAPSVREWTTSWQSKASADG